MLSLALVVAFFPAVYLIAAAQLGPAQTTADSAAAARISIGTQEQANDLEADLQSNPDNLSAQSALLVFYANEGNRRAFTKHLLWVIDHYPDAQVAFISVPHSTDQAEIADDQSRIAAAWERALTTHPHSAEVLYHAGLFIEGKDPQRALGLFQQAMDLAPSEPAAQERYLHAIALIYSVAVIADPKSADPHARVNSLVMTPAIASALRADIDSSINPKLLSFVGTTLVHLRDDQTGLSFLQRAIDTDPGNPQWEQAFESAKAEPIRRRNRDYLMSPGQPPTGVRLGAGVAEANLITRVEPIYPPLARQAGIQGTVEFTVTIGADGHVQSLQLVRGHPLLVNAAKDALLQWIFRPTMLNGKAVPVVTTIDILFHL